MFGRFGLRTQEWFQYLLGHFLFITDIYKYIYINDFKRYFKQVVVGFQKQPEDEWSFQSSDVGD